MVPHVNERLTLHFESRDSSGGNITCVGSLKDAILPSYSQIFAVLVCDEGDTGKTCAMQTLATDAQVAETFPDGQFYMSLGSDCSVSHIINGLAEFVRLSGSERRAQTIRSDKYLQKAVVMVVEWFKSHKCLLMFDGIWRVNDIEPGVVAILCRLLEGTGICGFVFKQRSTCRR